MSSSILFTFTGPSAPSSQANWLELQKYCTKLISKESSKTFNLSNFSSTPEKLLVSIIQNENHQMREIQVCEHVLK
ncbi:hypothetical protein C1645_834417 [Glomus cerebriforme]|uniref:Uncharacterized protein n=1 Tax=Glomus cerebriforme TaxID=658196 RepID=A0A397SKE8_9GLOM|nr:hypothetical protein C1645_834417 [Glomus cerebriforme]